MNMDFGRKWLLVGIWLIWFASLSVRAQQPPVKFLLPVYTPLDSWSFADTNGWTDDQGNAPISFTNLAFSILGNGSSLVVDTNVPAWLNYHTYQPGVGTTNLVVDGPGTISFWYAPAWATANGGPGQWSQLIDVGEWTTNASYGYWGLSVDSPGSNLWFSAQDGIGDTYRLSTPISWTTNYFHYLVLTYSSTNVSLYLDGQLATNDPGGLSIWPASQVISNGLFFGSDTNGFMKAQGLFNSVDTYDAVLDPDTIESAFDHGISRYLTDPFNAAAMNSFSQGVSQPSYTPTFDAITGQGELQPVGTASTCSDGTSAYDVWLTNIVAVVTNGGVTVTFTIEGGADGISYDVFAGPDHSVSTNGTSWTWLGQGRRCMIYTVTNLPDSAGAQCYLVLGTPQDTSGFGLTDAYEILVEQIDPNGPQTDSYGVPYAWYAVNHIYPITAGLATQDPDQDALLNYQEYFYGTKPKVSEGFNIWLSTPNGMTGIP